MIEDTISEILRKCCNKNRVRFKIRFKITHDTITSAKVFAFGTKGFLVQ